MSCSQKWKFKEKWSQVGTSSEAMIGWSANRKQITPPTVRQYKSRSQSKLQHWKDLLKIINRLQMKEEENTAVCITYFYVFFSPAGLFFCLFVSIIHTTWTWMHAMPVCHIWNIQCFVSSTSSVYFFPLRNLNVCTIYF